MTKSRKGIEHGSELKADQNVNLSDRDMRKLTAQCPGFEDLEFSVSVKRIISGVPGKEIVVWEFGSYESERNFDDKDVKNQPEELKHNSKPVIVSNCAKQCGRCIDESHANLKSGTPVGIKIQRT